MTTTYRLISDLTLGRLIRAAKALDETGESNMDSLHQDIEVAERVRRYVPFERNEAERCAHAMEKDAGHFGAALAVAFFRADGDNRARILAAFEGLFFNYDDESRRAKEDGLTVSAQG